MDKYEGILKNIARYVELTEEEKEQFTSIIKVSRIKKKAVCYSARICL